MKAKNERLSVRGAAWWLLLLTLPLSAPAQQLTEMRVVGTGEFVAGELVEKSIVDANGRVCAGLIVMSDLSGLTFSAYNGIVKVNQQPGRHFLFLSPDERVVEIYCSGFSPLKIILNDFDIRLESGKTWQLRITGEKDLIPITILTEPEGADITIDGISKGSSKIQHVGAGRHELRAEKKGYNPSRDTINVSSSSVLFNVKLTEIELRPVRIASVPAGAKITVNGSDKGETDKGVFLFPGRYTLRLTKSGYLDLEQTVDVTESGANTFTFTLTKNSGVLSLTVSPEDAVVLINKEVHTGRMEIDLVPGKYKVEVQKKGFLPATENIEIELGKTTAKTVTLLPRIGTLQFTVTPSDADVAMFSGSARYSSWKGMKVLKEVPVGDYSLECTRVGFVPATKTVTIVEGQPVLVEITMNPSAVSTAGRSDDEMVYVEGGSFDMGSDKGGSDEKPVHRVQIEGFYIAKHEVTQQQWREVMGTNPSHFKDCDRCPVEELSWDEVQEFIKKLNAETGKHYRLPTEAEWEFAARGGNKGSGSNFSGGNTLDDVAWYTNNSASSTHPVGEKKPNELGLYDMAGNVWEWCSDWYDENYYSTGPARNPTGPASGTYRVLRGGAWYANEFLCRIPVRFRYLPSLRINCNAFGFRLARD